MEPRLSLAELVASLALATDVGMGHPMEQGLGTAIVATRMGELAGLPPEDLFRTYYLALLRHIGCTAEREELAALVGDELALRGLLDTLTGAKASAYLGTFARFVMAGGGPVHKVRSVGRMASARRSFGPANKAICEVAQMLASRLGFDRALTDALATVYERWDGKGIPNHVPGNSVPFPVRITQVADLAAACHDLGHTNALETIQRRSGTGFDPDVAGLFLDHAPELLQLLDAPSRWEAVLRSEPGVRVQLTPQRFDEAMGAVADFADLQSSYLVGHSSGVASLARAAAEHLRLPGSDVDDVWWAGLVHDLGRVGVSTNIWGKQGSLTAGEWEQVRLHPYHAERVLGRSPFLTRLARIACAHHERLDGSGYFRGTSQLSPAARVLATADVYHAMTEPRPHRPALPPDRAASELRGEARAGRLDSECVDAVLASSGHRVGRRKEHAAGLTAREVEVLRLLARGLPTKAIAGALVVSPKTVENHIGSIYAKAGVATRAAATVFAMQHGLMDTLQR